MLLLQSFGQSMCCNVASEVLDVDDVADGVDEQ